MNKLKEIYYDIVVEGNSLVKNKKYLPDYFKFIMGIIAGSGLTALAITDHIIIPLIIIVISFLLFYFVKENIEATPTMVFSVKRDSSGKRTIEEVDKDFEEKN